MMANETPTYPQYTNLALGQGLFDQLMTAVRHHLDIEYDKQRLHGDDYTKAYIASMESVLGNSTQYLLGILLIDEKRDKLIADTDLTIQQTALTKVETAKAQFELDVIMPLQAEKLEGEIALLAAQVLLTNAQVLLTEAQTAKVYKEIEFLDQKIITERVNVEAGLAAPGSLLGRQIALLGAQKLGFAGDIQNKIAKLHADYAAVWQSVQEDETVPDLIYGGSTAAEAAINLAQATASEIKSVT